MGASFIIPQPIAQFPGGAQFPVLPSLSFVEPREGKRYIPVNVAWDGAGTTYNFNVQGLTTQPFSQIVMFDVDNSQSGAEVVFYFPDSSDTLVVPAESGGLFPVFTNGLNFYAAAPAALASDVTRFRILNYRQEPVALPPPEFSDVATALDITGASTTAVIPSSVSGTMTGYSVNFFGQSGLATAFAWTGILKDHATGTVIDQASAGAQSPSVIVFGNVMNVSGVAIRFSGGIDFVTTNTAAPASQSANVSIRYRTP